MLRCGPYMGRLFLIVRPTGVILCRDRPEAVAPSAHHASCWAVVITPAHRPVLAYTVFALEGAYVLRFMRTPLTESAPDAKEATEDEQIGWRQREGLLGSIHDSIWVCEG